MDIVQKPCAPGNWHPGRVKNPYGIVIHIAEGTLAGTDALFNTPPDERTGALKGFASAAHAIVGRSAVIHQYVKWEDTADHAGKVVKPSWPAILPGGPFYGVNPNHFTIGIEHEGTVDAKLAEKLGFTLGWPIEQQKASAELIWCLCQKFNIPIDRKYIVGHHEIRNTKPCPGPNAPIDAIIQIARGGNA